MKVYLVVVDDRAVEPGAFAFSTPEAAVAWARAWADEFSEHPDGPVEDLVVGHLVHLTYTGKGDGVWVVERDVDEPGADALEQVRWWRRTNPTGDDRPGEGVPDGG